MSERRRRWFLRPEGRCGAAHAAGAPAVAPEPERVVQLPRASVDVAHIGRPALRVYSVDDGLPQNDVLAVAGDAAGYLWVGTQEGAARYNGRSWASVGMPNSGVSNFVYAIRAASDGSIWFGTNAGAIRLWDGDWTVFDLSSGALPNDQVRCFGEGISASGASQLWVGTRGGLACFERGRWRHFGTRDGLPHEAVVALAAGREPGTMWVGTRAGLVRIERGRVLAAPDGVALDGEAVVSLLVTEDHDGKETLLAGTFSRGLARLEHGAWRFEDRATGFPASGVYSLTETVEPSGERVLWAGTDQGGLAFLRGGEWRSYDTSRGMPSNVVTSVLAGSGSERAVWAGTLGGGLVRVHRAPWLALDRRSGLPHDGVLSFLETDDSDGGSVLWIGTRNGLARVDDSGVAVAEPGAPGIVVTALERCREGGPGALWAGTRHGLGRYAGGTWRAFDTRGGLPHDVVFCLLETEDGAGRPVLWAGTGGGGLARYSDGQWTAFDSSSGLPHDSVHCLLETAEADGRRTLWAGTLGGGLAYLRDDRWGFYDATSGLPINSIYCLAGYEAPDGTRLLWAGTGGGGAAYIDLDDPSRGWTTLSEQSDPPIPNNTVYQIRADGAGRIYLATNRGVARLTPTATRRGMRFSVETFTTEDGLPGLECNGGASLVDGAGRVWVGTVSGAAMLDPAREIAGDGPRPLAIERVLVNGREADLVDGDTLAFDENNVTFEYALLSFFREGEIRYSAQLVGFDDAASPWSADWKRSYTNLPAGDYELRVWARDYRGEVTGPATRAFTVRPAPWRTWWAYLLYTGAAAGAGYAGTRLRTASLRRRNEQLEEIVRSRTVELAETIDRLRSSEKRAVAAKEEADRANRAKSVFLSNMSHELRTPLNAIIGFAQIMRREADRSLEDVDRLDTILRSGEHLLGLINDVLSISKIEAGKLTLTERPFDLRGLLRSVEEMARIRAEAKRIALVCEVAADFPPVVLGDDGKLRQILLNLLGNAVKFTERGRVVLRASWWGGVGVFEVEDTGPGIAADEIGRLFEPFEQTSAGVQSGEGTGLGLALSRTLARLMGGDISVLSEPGRGSMFAVTVALPEPPEIPADSGERRVVALAEGRGVLRVLVVDDNPEGSHITCKMLSSVGFVTRSVATGAGAIEVARYWRPHLVLLDLSLPDMDGRDVARRLRADAAGPFALAPSSGPDNDDPKVIALTASAFEHERDDVLAAGCDDFLVKPVPETELFETIGAHLGVRYDYEDGEDEPVVAHTAFASVHLPEAVAAELERACTTGDDLAASHVIDRLAAHDAELAERLRSLLRGYQFDEMLSVIRRCVQ